MPFGLSWLFDAAGGGPLALAAVVIAALASVIYFDQRAQIKELKADNREMRSILDRLADTVEAWTPQEQLGAVRRRLRKP